MLAARKIHLCVYYQISMMMLMMIMFKLLIQHLV